MPKPGLSDLKDPGDRYKLGELIGSGVCARVYKATDTQNGDKQVAIKVQTLNSDTNADLEEEYRVLTELSSHPNFPDFYGAYKKYCDGCDKVWFVMEVRVKLCDGGPVTDFVRGLQSKNKRMSEEHIAYILKEVVKALIHLHENNILHRDVKGSNILLTRNGEVRLVDYGLSRSQNEDGKRSTFVGSPSWMAPEIVMSARTENSYDNRADVWALGITAIELGDGVAPFEKMNPTRALFQILRNPPPTLYRPANWTQNYNDFINECLEPNPENRPFMVELIEHPFLTQLPENDFHLSAELKILLSSIAPEIVKDRIPEVQIRNGFLKDNIDNESKVLRVEDLAALEKINEETILAELNERIKLKKYYSFIGDILLFLNPYEETNDLYTYEYHMKYQFKSRSDNEPHIYSVADSAFQDMLHHNEPQHIVLSGETMSGKTAQCKHLINHLLFLGLSSNKVNEKIENSIKVIQAFGNAATSLNPNSTRHVLQTHITFSASGKASGAIFWLYQLDKWRIIGNRNQQRANFHIFYYFYDYLSTNGLLDMYKLNGDRKYRYLNTTDNSDDQNGPPGPKDFTPKENTKSFLEIKNILEEMEFNEEYVETIWRTLAAILVLGEVQFKENDDGKADIKNSDIASTAAQLLNVDEKKFCWALCNYCVILKGNAVKRKHTKNEAEEARHVLASTLYARLVDWIVNVFNLKLSFTRAVFGDKYYTSVLDMFGFECYQKNSLEQLFVNTLNEQLQYYYNQRIFVREMQEQEEDEIALQPLQYYDNKPTVDELMMKPEGLMYMLDEASRSTLGSEFIIETLTNKPQGPRVKMSTSKDFCVAHYTGKVMYDTYRIAEKNRDFLPPEMIETMRMSSNAVIKRLFTNQLTKSGNLTLSSEHSSDVTSGKKKHWGAALVAEAQSGRKYNTESRGEYSQTRRMRTASAIFRASSLEVIKSLGMGPEAGSTHFVRCIRSNLTNNPRAFQTEVVRHQLRALAVVDTARARQKGYSYRVLFNDFLRRYKFLAFDFDESVDITKDNCRLLLVRLKMEGWVIGKSKVFLRYYNEEYLSRLYETQVKKIVKVQSMMRAFLAKRNVASKIKKLKSQDSTATEPIGDRNERIKSNSAEGKPIKTKEELSEDEAALIIQTQFRGYQIRKQYGPLISGGKMDNATKLFMKGFFRRWKTSSIFHVLLLYRAAKSQDLVYFSQQAHLYNQNAVSSLIISNNNPVSLKSIDSRVKASEFLGEFKPAVWKLPFRLNEFPFCDNHLDPENRIPLVDDISWDDPFKYQTPTDYYEYLVKKNEKRPIYVREEDSKDVINFIQTPYCRDPNEAEVLYQGQPYRKYETVRRVQRKSIKGRAPTPQKDPATNCGVNVKQQISNMKDVNPAKTFSPNPPPNSFKYGQATSNANNNNVNIASNVRPKAPGKPREHNPIVELESKGLRNSTENDDDPPFNFQAMLRRTNVNRASLRRSPTPEGSYNQIDNIDSNQNRQGSNYMVHKQRNNNSYAENVIYNSVNPGQNQFYQSDIPKFNDERKRVPPAYKASSNTSNVNQSQTISTELLPGLVVEGKVAEL